MYGLTASMKMFASPARRKRMLEIANWPAFIMSWGVMLVWIGVLTLFIDYLGQMLGWWKTE